MVVVNLYEGDNFTEIRNVYVRLIDVNIAETRSLCFGNFGPYVGYIICTFYKQLADMENESKFIRSQPCRGNTAKKKESEQACLNALNHFT